MNKRSHSDIYEFSIVFIMIILFMGIIYFVFSPDNQEDRIPDCECLCGREIVELYYNIDDNQTVFIKEGDKYVEVDLG